MNSKQQSAGGKARAKIQKEEALAKYLINPSICNYCNSVILPKNKKGGVHQAKIKKFCNRSCSGFYHNKNKKKTDNYCKEQFSFCEMCKSEVQNIPYRQNYKKRKRCDVCKNKRPNLKVKTTSKFNLIIKGDLFSSCKNYFSARSTICKHAREVYKKSKKEYTCYICNYDKHVEVCHIKSVMSFSDLENIASTINNIDNLITLCRNHHWELDNNILCIVK